MSNKIGRNDTCHCGSGKKYKKCCLALVPRRHEDNLLDFEWRKVRRLEGAVLDRHLIPYITQQLPSTVMAEAIADILPDDLPDALDQELLFDTFFLPWSLFNWIPFDDFGVEDFDATLTVSENYLRSHESALSNREKRFIEEMNQTFYSFYTVVDVEIDKTVQVKDILLGTTHTIKERQGTHYLKKGALIFSRILTLDKQSIFVGMAPFTIPTDYHHNVFDFKKWLIHEENENENRPLTPELLRNELDIDLLSYFFEILEAAYNRPLPTLVNTDDESFEFSKSYFKLTLSPEEALARLLPMTLADDPNEFLSDAEEDESGKIKRIECPWLKKGNKKHAHWDNTVLGHITIKEDRLIIETNSQERTKRAKQLLMTHLGDAITFQQTLIETPEQKMKSFSGGAGDPQGESELLALPEVQEKISAMAEAHWKSWFDEPIPVLDNKTPREAAQTQEGREQLDVLLLQYEHRESEEDNAFFKADIDYLKRELELN